MMKDIHSGVTTLVALAAAALDADANGATVDLKGFDGCLFILNVGVGGITFNGTNKVDFILQESNDGSAWTAVADRDILGQAATVVDGKVRTLNAAHAAAATYRFGYKGYKRYVRLVADFSGTHGTATPMSAVALLRGMDNPQTNQAA